jgi:integrase
MMAKKRTQYGQGSVYQRGDGMWVAVALVPGQSPRRFYGSLPETAVERRADYLARHRLGLPTTETKLTLGRHLAGWLASKRPPTVRPSTWIGYELQVRHLSPLAGIPIAKLTPNDVRRHLRSLLDERLSPSSVRANLTVLRMALRQAVNDGLIQRNVASLVAAPRVERRQLAVLTPAEIRSFLAAAEQDPHGALWTLLLGSGLRLGEALALRWQDLDLTAGTLTVTGSLRPVDGRIRQPDQQRLARVEPKTDSGWRTIALPTTVLTALTAHRTAIADQKARSLAGYVFTTPRGTPIDPKNANRLFCRFLEANGLRRTRVHDLRHTAASIMLASGATFDDVRRHLGHSQIGVTVDTYGHLVEGRSAEVASGVERVLAR